MSTEQADCMMSSDSTRMTTVLVVLSPRVREILDSSGISISSSDDESESSDPLEEDIYKSSWK